MSAKAHKICVNKAQNIVHDPKDTLLETLEKNAVLVQYHCREGFCCACRTTLNSGEVEYTIAPLAYVDDDEILPCCCKPTSDIDISVE